MNKERQFSHYLLSSGVLKVTQLIVVVKFKPDVLTVFEYSYSSIAAFDYFHKSLFFRVIGYY